MGAWPIFLLLAAGLVLACSNETVSCHARGCFDGITAEVDLPPSAEASVQVCLNGSCSSGKLSPYPDGSAGFYAPGQGFYAAGGFGPPGQGPRHLYVYVELTGAAKNGDQYAIIVYDESGALLASANEKVTYGSFHPNGEACPPTCKRATIVLSPADR